MAYQRLEAMKQNNLTIINCFRDRIPNYSLLNNNIESKYIVIKVGYKRKFGRERNWIEKKSAKTEIIYVKAFHLE